MERLVLRRVIERTDELTLKERAMASAAKPLELSSGRLRAVIDPLGAQVIALDDLAAGSLLWYGDPSIWAGRAPILFPVIGCLAGGRYQLGNASYSMPKHGFARDSVFASVSAGPAEAVLALTSDSETAAMYPFNFQLRIQFVLADEAITISVRIANRGEKSMPASFGFHPALRWPLPYGGPRDEHILAFDKPEPAPIRRIDADGMLLAEAQPTPVVGREMHLTDALFEPDAVIMDTLASHRVVFGVPGRERVAVEFPSTPTLGIWTKPGAPFLCIEPWHGLPDPVGFKGNIFSKPGIIAVPPGSEVEMSMRISLARP